VIADLIAVHPDLQGVWHLAAEPISKYDLLLLAREILNLNVEVEPDEDFVCDRSLDGERFRRATGLAAPTWPEMIQQMSRDTTPYLQIRRSNAQR
jgi:dTDP-4-dehydrorhamnose reductase